MGEILKEVFDFVSIEFAVLFTAALPVIELKGAIPVGISLGLAPFHAVILTYLGSIIPVPIILFTIWYKRSEILYVGLGDVHSLCYV